MNHPTPKDYAQQVLEELAGWPEKHRRDACSDCGTFPFFQPIRFSWDEKTNRFVLDVVKEDYMEWTSWAVIGKADWRKICPSCAKKRGMS